MKFLELSLAILFVGCDYNSQCIQSHINDYLNFYGEPIEDYIVIDREGFAIGFDYYAHQPRWAAYRITELMLTNKVVERSNIFRLDSFWGMHSATPEDYHKSGYDRGHLVPAADMRYDQKAMKDSFLMSNMSPQTPEFNRGIWKRLEEWVRIVCLRERSIAVVSGPLFDCSSVSNTIGESKVWVPVSFYKVILDETAPQKAIGFIIPNEGTTRHLGSFAKSVDEVEKITGMDFFAGLEETVQHEIEGKCKFDDWGIE